MRKSLLFAFIITALSVVESQGRAFRLSPKKITLLLRLHRPENPELDAALNSLVEDGIHSRYPQHEVRIIETLPSELSAALEQGLSDNPTIIRLIVDMESSWDPYGGLQIMSVDPTNSRRGNSMRVLPEYTRQERNEHLMESFAPLRYHMADFVRVYLTGESALFGTRDDAAPMARAWRRLLGVRRGAIYGSQDRVEANLTGERAMTASQRRVFLTRAAAMGMGAAIGIITGSHFFHSPLVVGAIGLMTTLLSWPFGEVPVRGNVARFFEPTDDPDVRPISALHYVNDFFLSEGAPCSPELTPDPFPNLLNGNL